MLQLDKGLTGGIRTEPVQETIYRYRPINERLQSILERDELYFATHEACSDPFDCRSQLTLDDPVKGFRTWLKFQVTTLKLYKLAGLDLNSQAQRLGLAMPNRLLEMTEAELDAYAEQIYGERDFGNSEVQVAEFACVSFSA